MDNREKDNKKNIVGGYFFENEQQADLARRELDTIQYLREMNNMKNPKVMFQIYEKIVKKKLFITPIGIDYVKNLQKQLLAHFDKKDILPIPILDNKYSPTSETVNSRKKMMEFNDVGNNYKKKLKISIIINIMFAAALAVMIFIASTTKSPHILNYENRLVDRYEQWEEELNKREEQLNNRSRQ